MLDKYMQGVYKSLLFPGEKPNFQNIPPEFYHDLQLDHVCKAILSKYTEFDIKKYLYTLPTTEEVVVYRQNIYRDMEANDWMILGMKRYTNHLLQAEKSYRFYLQVEDDVKKGSYLLLTCQNYLYALDILQDLLQKANLKSAGLIQLRTTLENHMGKDSFQTFRKKIQTAFSYMEQLRLTLLLRKHEICVLEQDKDEKESFIQKLNGLFEQFGVLTDEYKEKSDIVKNIFPAPLETTSLENTIVELLQNSHPKSFEVLKDFASFEFSLEGDFFVGLKEEFVFYISFYEFEQQLKTMGYELQFPTVCKDTKFEIEEVYDIALAWKNRFSNYHVVRNNIQYEDGKSFLVVTGPNQGGKTTLARALGQSVYFTHLGLKAPCKKFQTPFFEQILTHFEVEESVETGAGKLKEELQRLRPMMLSNSKNCFIILNELFTTATTYDAQIMAKRVMEHFMSHHCIGIYVTHIQELADETDNPGIQSMVAQVEPNNHSVRTFRILPMKAEGLGYSDSIVKKYHLDFEEVTQRISHL